MTLQRKTPLRSVSVKKAEKKRMGVSDLKKSGLVSKASEFTQKPRKRMRPRAKLKSGQQSQVAFFLEIWSEREHVSEISGLPLIDTPDDWEDEAHVKAWLSQFSHVLAKGQYRRFKDRKDNILLKTAAEHEFWEKNKPNARNAYVATPDAKRVGTHDGWMMCDRLYIRLRDEANNVASR